MIKAIYIFLTIAVVAALFSTFLNKDEKLPEKNEPVACPADAMQCPDGSFVGRTGPDCEFVCPDVPKVPEDIQQHIEAKADLIKVSAPLPNAIVDSPLEISGEARGKWFFEATFPIVLTDWDGRIIAEGYATAQDDWMSEEFVPFQATIEFVNPFNDDASEFMKKGNLILQRSNPSGLPENDDALEIPVRFAE